MPDNDQTGMRRRDFREFRAVQKPAPAPELKWVLTRSGYRVPPGALQTGLDIVAGRTLVSATNKGSVLPGWIMVTGGVMGPINYDDQPSPDNNKPVLGSVDYDSGEPLPIFPPACHNLIPTRTDTSLTRSVCISRLRARLLRHRCGLHARAERPVKVHAPVDPVRFINRPPPLVPAGFRRMILDSFSDRTAGSPTRSRRITRSIVR